MTENVSRKVPVTAGMTLGMTFPCIIDIKVFLPAHENNSQWIKELLLQSIALTDLHGISVKESKNAKYHSLCCRVNAQDKTLIDAVFTRLSAHPAVLMVI